ncbi:hypothetical protein HWV62_30469 [Athelia sp. TMB]|nr:hypothetical protein HWV62_30469 [Athelia sp. TMB]
MGSHPATQHAITRAVAKLSTVAPETTIRSILTAVELDALQEASTYLHRYPKAGPMRMAWQQEMYALLSQIEAYRRWAAVITPPILGDMTFKTYSKLLNTSSTKVTRQALDIELGERRLCQTLSRIAKTYIGSPPAAVPAALGTPPAAPGTLPAAPGTLPAAPGTPPAAPRAPPAAPRTPPASPPRLPVGRDLNAMRDAPSKSRSGSPFEPTAFPETPTADGQEALADPGAVIPRNSVFAWLLHGFPLSSDESVARASCKAFKYACNACDAAKVTCVKVYDPDITKCARCHMRSFSCSKDESRNERRTSSASETVEVTPDIANPSTSDPHNAPLDSLGIKRKHNHDIASPAAHPVKKQKVTIASDTPPAHADEAGIVPDATAYSGASTVPKSPALQLQTHVASHSTGQQLVSPVSLREEERDGVTRPPFTPVDGHGPGSSIEMPSLPSEDQHDLPMLFLLIREKQMEIDRHHAVIMESQAAINRETTLITGLFLKALAGNAKDKSLPSHDLLDK